MSVPEKGRQAMSGGDGSFISAGGLLRRVGLRSHLRRWDADESSGVVTGTLEIFHLPVADGNIWKSVERSSEKRGMVEPKVSSSRISRAQRDTTGFPDFND